MHKICYIVNVKYLLCRATVFLIRGGIMEEKKDSIGGRSKPIPKKKMMIIVITTLCVLLAVFVGIIIWQATSTAPSLTNLNKVEVSDCLNANQSITIPIKVKKVYYNPFKQQFDSDLSLKQLCTKATEYDSNVKYQITGDVACLYKETDGKIIARAALHNKSTKTDYKYLLENMYVEGIVFPTHKAINIVDNRIVLNETEYNCYAVSFMTVDELYNWLIGIENYKVERLSQDTIICNYKNNNTPCKTQIYFDGNLIALKEIGNF